MREKKSIAFLHLSKTLKTFQYLKGRNCLRKKFVWSIFLRNLLLRILPKSAKLHSAKMN